LIPIGVMPSNHAWMRLSLRRVAPVLAAALVLAATPVRAAEEATPDKSLGAAK
jgi:hypothetical protein